MSEMTCLTNSKRVAARSWFGVCSLTLRSMMQNHVEPHVLPVWSLAPAPERTYWTRQALTLLPEGKLSGGLGMSHHSQSSRHPAAAKACTLPQFPC